MATGSPAPRHNSASKGFDFAADDNILCSYEDYADQDASNGSHSDSAIVLASTKEFHKNRTARSMFPPAPGESFSHDVASIVENTMKKHTDNVMRFLEGISSRLSQLELYCYNLDKSVGEMRSDLERDHSEADLKLRSLDKHLQEVHRSVQIMKDKQELAETQKELAKLHLAQKETSSGSNSQQNEERASASSTPEIPKKPENKPEIQGMQLALALPQQPQSVTQQQAYYVPAQLHYVPSDINNRPQQMQAQSQVNQAPQYQQQWIQQLPQQQPQSQQMTPLQSSMRTQQLTSLQSSMGTQVRPQLTAVYPQYPPSQPANPTPESLPNGMPMIPSYPGVSQPEAPSYVYLGPTGTLHQQPPPQQQQPYGYLVYEGETKRPINPPQHQQSLSHYPQGGFPSLQGPQANNVLVRVPQVFRGHPHGEVIEKLVNMGYRSDHVSNVVQRLEESGQPVDFNAVLDRLNGHPSGGSQGGWSG